MLNVFKLISTSSGWNDFLKLFSTYRKSLSIRYFLKFSDSETEGVDITNYVKSHPTISQKLEFDKISNVKTEVSITLDKQVKNLFVDSSGNQLDYNGRMILEIYLDIPKYIVSTSNRVGDYEDGTGQLLDISKGAATPDGYYYNSPEDQMLFRGRIKEYPVETTKEIKMSFISSAEKIKSTVYRSLEYAQNNNIGLKILESGKIAYIGPWLDNPITPDEYIYIDDYNIISSPYYINRDTGFYIDDGSGDYIYIPMDNAYAVAAFLLLLAGYTIDDIDQDSFIDNGIVTGEFERIITKNYKIIDLLNELARDAVIFIYANTIGKWKILPLVPTINYDIELTDKLAEVTNISFKSQFKDDIIVKYFPEYTTEDNKVTEGDFTRTKQKTDEDLADEWPFIVASMESASNWIQKNAAAQYKLDMLTTIYQNPVYLIKTKLNDLGFALEIGDIIKITTSDKDYPGIILSVSKNLSSMSTNLEVLYIEGEYDKQGDYAPMGMATLLYPFQTVESTSEQDYIIVMESNDTIDIWADYDYHDTSTSWSTLFDHYKQEFIYNANDFKNGDEVIFIGVRSYGGTYKYDLLFSGKEYIIKYMLAGSITGTVEVKLTTPIDTSELQTALNNYYAIIMTQKDGYIYKQTSNSTTYTPGTGQGLYF